MGAIVSQKQMDTVLGYIDAGKKEGATILAGGKRACKRRPWVLYRTHYLRRGEKRHEGRAGRNFWTGAGQSTFEDMEEVIEAANKNIYGLAAAVWTHDLKNAHVLSSRLEERAPCG